MSIIYVICYIYCENDWRIQMGSRLTIKNIAEKCGVSTATVSRALNGNGYVSDSVKERIVKTCKETGYIQNVVARSLRENSSKIIGYITSDISNLYHVAVAKGVEEVISAQMYNLIVCSSNGEGKTELQYIDSLISRNVDAIIINPTGKNNDYICTVSHDIPFVSVNRRIESNNYIGDFADSGNYSGTYQLAQELLQYGHRCIYFIGGSSNLSNARERYNGFKDAMANAGINTEKDYPYIYNGNFSEKSGYDGIIYMLGHFSVLPTAVLCANNGMAIGALKAFYDQHIDIPRQFSVSCFNQIDNMQLFKVQPSVASFSPLIIGQIAGRFALERIRDKSIKNRELIIPPTFIHGNAVDVPRK